MKQRHLFVRFANTVGCCLYAAAFGSALAQNAPVQGQPAPQGLVGLQEIVVTAEKRSESLEKAPIALTAITGENLTSMGVTSSADLSAVVPNFTAAPNSNGSTVAIRGIVSTSQTVNGNSEVSYSVDGVSLVNMRAAFDGMYDLNRVEVLRGPQGTLYGANANAGGINVITNKPDLTDASASGSIGFGNYDAFSSGGMINMPISDTLGFRVAVDDERHQGYINLTTNDRRFDDQDFTGGRVHLLWKPSDDFSALLTYETGHNGGAGTAGSGSGATLGLYATQQGATPYQYASMPGPNYLDETTDSATLTLDWSLPWFDVNYIGNVRTDNWLQSIAETIFGPEASICQSVTSTNCNNPGISSSINRQNSDELRFSKNTDRVKWLLGLYYLKYNAHLTQSYEPAQNNPDLWQQIDAPGFVQESKAIYGQTTWNITDKLSVVGGLRYQQDSSILPYSPVYYGPIGSIVQQQCIGCTVTSVYSGSGSWGKTTWRAGVNYDFTPTSLLFASIATGYEQGGFSSKAEEPFNPVYGPENLTNYELGWKGQFLDNRLRLNADAFYMDYKDYQASASETLDNGMQALLTQNAGSAAIKGIELESTYLLTPQDELSFNATVLRAVFTEFYLPQGDGYGAVKGIAPANYTGNELPYAPHQTARISYKHSFVLGDADSLIGRVDSSYSAHYWLDYHDYSAVAQDAYTRSDASLTWEHHSGSKMFSTQLYVRNIENKAILVGGQADNNAPNRDFNDYGKNGYYMAPRTYGIKFIASF